MRKAIVWMSVVVLTITACSGQKGKGNGEGEQLMQQAYRAKAYPQMLALADSLQQVGSLSEGAAYYWQGYACDRMGQRRMAEFFWKEAIAALENSTRAEDLSVYVKAASRLVNEVGVRGDYEWAELVATTATERLEKLKCDTTSDYVNLLIFKGCCEMSSAQSEKVAEESLERAYKMHLANIARTHSTEAYKNAIAGIINIAFNCIAIHHYEEALHWTDRYGQLISDYEVMTQERDAYIDKQQARYDIYRAIALEGLGRSEEAAEAYGNYEQTRFSQTAEGRADAGDFLITAQRWDEAADKYQGIDVRQGEHSLDNLQKMALKKFRANWRAGRRDSAVMVSMQICELLDSAITKSRRLDAEEHITIREKETEIASRQAVAARQRLMTVLGVLGLLAAAFIAYALYRRKLARRMTQTHDELKSAYGQLEENSVAKGRAEREQHIALDIQQSLMPAALPQRSDVSLYAALPIGEDVSSDFCDFYIRDEKLIFCIGSVEGHGLEAALAIAMAKAGFRTASASGNQPDRVMSDINQALFNVGKPQMPVALFVGVLDLQTGRLYYANGGHEAPLLAGSGIGLLPAARNTPVGVRADGHYTLQESLIDPGTVILLYTNSLTRAENQAHQPFGEKRLLSEALQAAKVDAAPEAFVTHMTEAVHRFTGSAAQQSDLTVMAIRYTKKNSGISYQRSISLANDEQEIPRLTRFTEKVAAAVRLDAAATEELNLLLGELVVNVMSNAYEAGEEGDVNVEARADKDELVLVVRDSGKPFDLAAVNDAVHHYMDTVSCERQGHQNVFTFIKKLQKK